MHIGFRTSGGRGEYEVVGSHSGLTALELEGWSFSLRWPDGIVRETGLELDPATSKKARLRSTRTDHFQIGRMVTAMLLLPAPRREYGSTGSSTDVVTAKGFVVARLGFGPDTEFAPLADLVTVEPTFVLLKNLLHAETIGVEWRWARVAAVYAASGTYHPSITAELQRHQAYMASGRPVDQSLSAIVARLAKAIERVDPAFSSERDPLPALERLAGLEPGDSPPLPTPDRLGEDEPEVSARSAHEYRLAKMRGPGAQKFSLDVRNAYGHRCAFCGAQLGGLDGIRSGVDAAHILAWSKYELDVVQNGISLCKTHHWAFDAALLVPELVAGIYRVRFTTLTERLDSQSLKLLGTDRQVIPAEWLPGDTSRRPSAKYLNVLYEDLAISFVA